MSTTTISTTLTSEVTPGTGTYAANILVTGVGAIIAPIALYAASPASLLNRGNIAGLIDFQNTAAVTNHGTISGPGISLLNSGELQNTGDILAPLALTNASLNNSGTITGTITATGSASITNTGVTRTISLTGAAALTNSGIITGGVTSQNAVYNQSGAITGPTTAILLNAYGLVTNAALISGGDTGIALTSGGSVINSGTIAGGTNAISGNGYIYLTAESGAAFRGNVIDASGHGQLNLAGAGSLNIANFTGFNILNLAPLWTLEGGQAQLAAGQSIRGFAPGGTLILDGFAATGESLTPSGLVLTNGAASTTLALKNFSADDSLILTAQAQNTTLTAHIATIAISIYTEVNPGTGYFAENLTVTGAINVPSGYAIDAGPVSLTNFGQITGNVRFRLGGSLDNHGAITGPAGVTMFAGAVTNAGSITATSGNGVYLGQGASLANTGTIRGPNFGVNAISSQLDNAGAISGNIGVNALASSIANTGAISGGIGIELNRSTLTNSGTITGYAAILAYAGPVNTVSNPGAVLGINYGAEFFVPFTLLNAGLVEGARTGVYVTNRAGYGYNAQGGHHLTNTGTIFSPNIAVELSYTIPGFTPAFGQNFLTNAGTISGGTYAVENRTGTLFLTALPGAVFQGAVADLPGGGDLILAGTTAGSLDITSFSGFSTLDFAPGATWSLGATPAELAGQTITGFSPGDTLILDGFSAATATFIPTTGLILSNPTASATLAIRAMPPGFNFAADSVNGGTTITLEQPMISTIASYFLGLVTPGSGNFSPDLLVSNTGILVGGHNFPTAADVLGPGVTLTNDGEIIGGASLGAGALILNHGTIYDVQSGAGQFGISSGSFGTIINTGTITGTRAAINLTAGGILFNAAQLGAVLDTGALSLILETGAAFSGPVTDTSGNGQLTLTGGGNLVLDSAHAFSGFSTISFEPGAVWSLEGNIADLASGQTISDLNPGDALILDGFAASTYAISGNSLILSNPTASATLNLTAIPQNRFFSLSPAAGGTRITPENAIVSTITTTITNQVTPGDNNYTSPLTITGTGVVNTGSLATAVFSNDYHGILNNAGQILAYGSQFDGLDFTEFGTLLNTGTIFGGSIAAQAGEITNSGTLWGGVEGAYVGFGALENTGAIQGGSVGVQLGASVFGGINEVTNSGSIGGGIGVSISGVGRLTNSGTISGTTYAVLTNGPFSLYVNPGAVFNGAIADTAGNGVLVLQGTTAGSLNLGHGLSGFSTIDFAPGSTWTLEGDNLAVALNHQINGFTSGDTIILDGVSATPQNFVYGATGAPGHLYVVYQNIRYLHPYTVGVLPGGPGGYGLTVKLGAVEVNSNIVFGGKGGSGASGGTVPLTGKDLPFLTYPNGGPGGNGGVGAHVTGGILINNGYIGGGPGGLGGASDSRYFHNGATGTGGNGLYLRFGTVINHGWIGGITGAIIANGILADYGTIAGLSGDAVSFSAGAGTLLVGTGGALLGDAVATANDQLILAGTSSTAASIGTQFLNFGTISFGKASAWTLEGSAAALAAVQTITGFNPGDTLVLENFAATYENFGGAGLTLTNATYTTTIALSPPSAGRYLSFASYLGNTTLTETASPPVVINTYNTSGVVPASGASITITQTGTIATAGPAIYVASATSNVFILNNGTLITPNTPLPAIDANGAYTTIANNGPINAQQAVYLSQNGTLLNSGNISGAVTNFGVRMVESYLNNSGTIAAAVDAVIAFETSAVTNTGDISGATLGVILNAGMLTNSGTIASPLIAVDAQTASTVINAGTISGGRYAVYATGTETLIIEPGAVFSGPVADPDNAGILILASNTQGSLNLADFSGFSTLAFAPGAYWTLEGTATQLAAGETITGLTQPDTIILDGFTASTYSYVTGTGLILSNTDTLNITGSFSTTSFIITDTPDGNTEIQLACFLRGTRILTPHGNIAIEKLNIGDLVRTMHGDQPIRWIGRRAYAARFISDNPDALPIRIRRHAIAHNIPSRDLYVSPDHAIAEGGVLIHAHLLQNGISITQPNTAANIEYFHLEFDTHTVLFAENLSTESFIDEGAGNRFQNSHTRPLATETQQPCLPRVFEGFHLHNITSRIASRAGILEPTTIGPLRGIIDEQTPTLIRGWAQNSAAPEHPVTLEIISGSYNRVILANAFRPDLRAAGLGSGRHAFSLMLPNLPGPITVRRASDHAPLPPPAPRHCEPAKTAWQSNLRPPLRKT